MNLTEKLFIVWIIACVSIFGVSILALVLALKNRRDIKNLSQ